MVMDILFFLEDIPFDPLQHIAYVHHNSQVSFCC